MKYIRLLDSHVQASIQVPNQPKWPIGTFEYQRHRKPAITSWFTFCVLFGRLTWLDNPKFEWGHV